MSEESNGGVGLRGLILGAVLTLCVSLLTSANSTALAREDDLDTERRAIYSEFLQLVEDCTRIDEPTDARIREVAAGMQAHDPGALPVMDDVLGGSDCTATMRAASSRIYLVATGDVLSAALQLGSEAHAHRASLLMNRLVNYLPEWGERMREDDVESRRQVAIALDRFETAARLDVLIDDNAILADSMRLPLLVFAFLVLGGIAVWLRGRRPVQASSGDGPSERGIEPG